MITTLDVETTFDVDADNKITSSPFNGNTLVSVGYKTDDNPFDSEYFTNIEHADGRDEPLREDTPCIVIATSGMLEGGPVLEYF